MSKDEGPWGRPLPWHATRKARRLIWLGLIIAVVAGVGGLMALFPGRITSTEDWGFLIRSLGMLALVAAGLIGSSRRLRLKDSVRHAAVWIGVGGVLVLAVAYRVELTDVGQRLRSALVPGYAVATKPHELMLTQDSDGDFRVVGQVNGQPVTFVVDTGASDIVLSPADAKRVGIDLAALHFDHDYETANGTGRGAPFTATSLAVGPIQLSHVALSVNQAPMSASLLGMTFFKQLDSFEMKNGRLVMHWRG
jgi:aspartyl protease family protein